MKPFASPVNVPTGPRAVQLESRRRVSSDTAAYVHAAHAEASQKRALHATIHSSTAPTKAIAEAAGVGYSALANAALTSEPGNLPFARLPLVLEASDNLTLLRFYAQLQGCEVFRLPRVGAVADGRQAAAAMREFAELLEAGAAAAEDAVITPAEFARIDREADDALRAILEYRASYRARVQRPLLEGM